MGNGFEEKKELDRIGEEMKENERKWRDFSPLLLITRNNLEMGI